MNIEESIKRLMRRTKEKKNFIATRRSGNEAKNFLVVLYTQLLQRSPDTEGLESWLNQIDRGLTLTSVLERFLQSDEFKRNLPKLMAKNVSELSLINGFSQFQEDEILISHILTTHFKSPYVVDIGAHSITGSNSFVFSQNLQWPTLLIEANKDLIYNLQQHFPVGTKILNTAVGIETGFVDFYVSDNDYVSSTNRQQAEQWGFSTQERRVPIRKIGDVLADAKVPLDFALLTIDIEGSDMIVINDLLSNTRYRPQYIIAEALYTPSEIDTEHDIPQSVLLSYEVIAKTHANLILKAL